MNILDVEQHSPEWLAARIGMVTASKVHAITRKRKRGTGELQGRIDFKTEMLAEILSGCTTEHYVTQYMEAGIENEPRAVAEYEFRTGLNAEHIGLVLHPSLSRAAASPDRLIAPDGLVEVKCPARSTHIEYLLDGSIPEKYCDQIDWQMACCGPEIKWVDFVSYHPDFVQEFQLFIVRRKRDDKRIAEMEADVIQFITEVDAMALRLHNYGSGMTALLEKSIKQARTKRGPQPVADALEDLGVTEEDVRA